MCTSGVQMNFTFHNKSFNMQNETNFGVKMGFLCKNENNFEKR